MGDLKRKTATLLVLVLALGALAVGMPSPAAASYYETGVSFSRRIVRDSIPYRLNVKAIETMGFTYSLEVTISRTRDPSGPTELKQKQAWVFPLDEGEFTRDGDTYRINAGSSQEPFHVNLVIERRQGARCGPDQTLFVTQPENQGAFRIDTGNAVFGTISELAGCATPYDFSSGQVPGPPPCPLEGKELQSPPLTVKERTDGDVARVLVYDARKREVAPGHLVDWFVQVRGTVPGTRFDMDSELTGSFRAGSAPWLDGTARFDPKEAAGRIDWYECRGNREALTFERAGALTGDMTLDVIGYDTQRITDPDALARRSRARPSPSF